MIATSNVVDKKKKALRQLKNNPYKLGQLLGFTKLQEIHNEWIKSMVIGDDDETLLAHRGSYKTTCVSIALALIVILFPNDKTQFIRKTDTDVIEIIAQTKKILESTQIKRIVNTIYNTDIILTKVTANEINTNLGANDPRGTSQLVGIGTKSSLTGKHYDRIFTDDIVNKEDRASKAEREKTKTFYQELQNIKNRETASGKRKGRIFNTGTPWHKDDAIQLMPNVKRYDCYSTGLISSDIIQALKEKMTKSLFSANYELRHVAEDDILFDNPVTGAEVKHVYYGTSHIDASYGGEDGSAFTIVNKKGGKYYVFGKLRHKHIDVCEDEFIGYYKEFMCDCLRCEDNGDKGYLGKDLRQKGVNVKIYHEKMNKYIKISSYLKAVWRNVVFVEGTDQEYIDQIEEYNIDAKHDDAPDSLASIIRKMWGKNEPDPTDAFMQFA